MKWKNRIFDWLWLFGFFDAYTVSYGRDGASITGHKGGWEWGREL